MPDLRAQRFTSRLRPLQASLESVCRRMAWGSSNWEDVLQKAIMVAWTRFDTYDESSSFRSWIFSVVINTVLNENRAYRRLHAHENQMESDKIDYIQEISKEEAYQGILQDPEAKIFQFRSSISSALQELGPQERAAFLLRSVGELKYSEIADALGIPIGTVMSHLHRTRLRLRERLAEEFVGQGEARRNDP